jgi:hypothetical protein
LHVRVQRWGNSLAVRIPKPLAEDADVKEGTVLNLAAFEGKLSRHPLKERNCPSSSCSQKSRGKTCTRKLISARRLILGNGPPLRSSPGRRALDHFQSSSRPRANRSSPGLGSFAVFLQSYGWTRILCPITSQVKGYPFEVTIASGSKLGGVILADQVKSFDWRIRKAEFICKLPREITREA